MNILTPSYSKTSLVERKCVCASTVLSMILEKLSFSHRIYGRKKQFLSKSYRTQNYVHFHQLQLCWISTSNMPITKQQSGSAVFRVVYVHWIHARYMSWLIHLKYFRNDLFSIYTWSIHNITESKFELIPRVKFQQQ